MIFSVEKKSIQHFRFFTAFLPSTQFFCCCRKKCDSLFFAFSQFFFAFFPIGHCRSFLLFFAFSAVRIRRKSYDNSTHTHTLIQTYILPIVNEPTKKAFLESFFNADMRNRNSRIQPFAVVKCARRATSPVWGAGGGTPDCGRPRERCGAKMFIVGLCVFFEWLSRCVRAGRRVEAKQNKWNAGLAIQS